jgi:hypothetical protein
MEWCWLRRVIIEAGLNARGAPSLSQHGYENEGLGCSHLRIEGAGSAGGDDDHVIIDSCQLWRDVTVGFGRGIDALGVL